jgi:biopolymer transport protein ExbD
MSIVEPGKRFGPRFEHSKMLGHAAHGAKSVNADLNVTPLVDMFVILVLFLIANFSATGEILQMNKDIALPEAAHGDELSIAPIVMISKTEVIVSGTLIGRVEDLSREDYLNIPALEENLRDLKKRTEDMHSQAGDTAAFKSDINIQADKDVTFKIVKRVMFSCSSAGYGTISFAVMSTAGAKKEGTETASR